jgi:hypothetical protein
MTIAILFWILMLLWLIDRFWADYVPNAPYPMRRVPGNILVFVLFLLLGWSTFGKPITDSSTRIERTR